MKVKVGDLCMAPVKRDSKRQLEDVEITWVSHDGSVVEAETVRKGKKLRSSYSVTGLRPLGTEPPPLGVVI